MMIRGAALASGLLALAAAGQELRPPAVPLVTHDPYFSVWSFADRATDGDTRHWTGRPHRLTSLLRVDGKSFRLLGAEPKELPALPQKSVRVTPTRTIYKFGDEAVAVTLTFTTPAIPADLDLLSRPVTYVTWDVSAKTGGQDAAVYFNAGAELAVNVPEQAVRTKRGETGPLTTLMIGSAEQPALKKSGDDLRIDWGWLCLAADRRQAKMALGPGRQTAATFAAGQAPEGDSSQGATAHGADRCTAAATFALGDLGSTPVSRTALIAYDDELSIQYFGAALKPYWRRNGATFDQILVQAAAEKDAVVSKCIAFDDELRQDAIATGGEKYADIVALAHRQSLAGGKLAADANGAPLYFAKENFSNGCIATVDVIYPQIPQFLLLNPTLAKASCVHCFAYAATPYWRFPFAPHDLGTYPKATGQVYGQGEAGERDQMPVEESGNLLLIAAAIAKIDGHADFVAPYWKPATAWAEYLAAKGFDPENQLCTDDFAGHLAHNANLSIKAILGLAAYGQLCDARGEKAAAARYARLAKELAAKWQAAAAGNGHTTLVFGAKDTWSQKYNLVWDRILGLEVFPSQLAQQELAWYRGEAMGKFGPPLDSRKKYAKLDWTLWSAALTGEKSPVEALAEPLWRYLHESPSRVPMSDWYETDTGKQSGFQARPVVGGVFMPLLGQPALAKKWAARAAAPAATWAPIVKRPVVKEVVPTARTTKIRWSFTLEKPAAGWISPNFAAAGWRQGEGGFGTAGTPGARIGTEWKTSDIWLRREFELPATWSPELRLLLHHDDDVEVQVNGVAVFQARGFTTDYQTFPLSEAARAALRPGKNVLAIHCHQHAGGQYVDAGFAELVTPD